jgi:hypothetical protein
MRPLLSMDNHATTNPYPSHELPERSRSARDLVLAGVAVGGDKQFAVDELQLVHRDQPWRWLLRAMSSSIAKVKRRPS